MRPTRAALLLVALSFALRAAYAVHGIAHPESRWQEVDPDRYVEHGRMLVRDGNWRWTLDSVVFRDGATGFIKSPLYQIFLSLFARFTPDYPTDVPLGHAALGALTTAAVFILASALHSPRAGLIAAAIHATWLVSIVSVMGFWQEQLYIPLFALATARCVRSFESRRDETRGGVMLALAALTRSMPLWLAPIALAFRRRRAVAVFAALLVPYVIYLSLSLGRVVVVENVGPAYVFLSDPPQVTSPRGPRPFYEMPAIVARQFAADPVFSVRALIFNARMTYTIAPHRWLEFHAMFRTEARARLARAVSWMGTLPEIAVLLLAPFGVVLARNRRGAALAAAWVVATLLLTAIAAHQGARFRVPVDALLIALAACVMAGGWSRPKRPHFAVAALGAIAAAGCVALIVPHATRIRADFGLSPWQTRGDVRVARLQEPHAGFGVHPLDGMVKLLVRCTGGAVSIDIDTVQTRLVDAPACDGRPVAVEFPTKHYSYIRMSAAGATSVELELADDVLSAQLMAKSRGTHLAFPAVEWLSPDGCGRCVNRQGRHSGAVRPCSSAASWCSPSGSFSAPAGPRCSAIS